MTMRQVTVTGQMLAPDGAALAGAVLRASLARHDWASGGGMVLPGFVEAVADAAGNVSLPLWTTASGLVRPDYTLQVRHPSIRSELFEGVQVPDVASITLAELLGGDLDGAAAAPGSRGVSLTNFVLPGETLATDGTAILERALASTTTDFFIPAGHECVVNAPVSTQARLVGKTLRGPGTLRFVAGNLRLGSGTRVLGQLRVTGTGKTNGASGLSILSGSDNILIHDVDIQDVHHNGININGGTTRVRVLFTRVRGCGGAGIVRSYQGCGLYASGQSQAIMGLRVVGLEVEEAYGIAGIMLQTCTATEMALCGVTRTWGRGICLTGTNTGRVWGCDISECGAINTTLSGVGCNGIFCNLTTTAQDVVIANNRVRKVAENGIEGRATIVGNDIADTGAYPTLATPSIEGVYMTGDATAIGNRIVRAAGHGLVGYSEVSAAGFLAAHNQIVSPGGSGMRVQVKGAASVLSGGGLMHNWVFGGNSPALPGIEVVIDAAGGAYSDFRAVGNEVWGRSLNTIHAQVAQRGNSWQ